MSATTPTSRADLLLPASPTSVNRVAELLNAGQLVVLPTETVYGIAVNLASPAARDAARQLKQRAEGRTIPNTSPARWVVHVAHPEDVFTWAPHLTALGKRLITKSLPGPVAFEIKLDPTEPAARTRLGDAASETIEDHRITLRCPDFALTQEILAAVKSPVAIIGAGTTAQPAAYEPDELPAHLTAPDSPIAAVLDGGQTRYRKASTLVRIDGDAFSVLRAGVIDERIIQRMADFTLLFLCTGNTCRSPMAAAIAARLLADRVKVEPAELPLRHIVVQSAGLHTSKGLRATLEAIDAVKPLGGELSTHLSQPATPDLLRRADLVYTMTDAHLSEVTELYPWAARKSFRLDPQGDIADPIGSSQAVYQRVAKRLQSVLQERFKELSL